jgi:hypothetical protein
MTKRRRMTAITASVVALTTAATVAPAGAASGISTQVASDATWIRQAQLSDGAIAWYVDRQRIDPYLANYAAIGLAQAYKVTGTKADLTAATAWLGWYAGHENAAGFVTDYTVSGTGLETSTGDMDSTDAYAGTFLLAVRAAYRAGGGSVHLQPLAAGIRGAVAAIEATQDADGLTWAKPTWHVKYLMDQAEAFAGLQAAADLGNALGDAQLTSRATSDAKAMASGVSTLWDAPTGGYDWARHDGGAQATTDWGTLYPDAMEQEWPAAFGLTDAARGATVVAELASHHQEWNQPDATDLVNGAQGPVGYWPLAGWADLRLGDTRDAATAAGDIRTAAVKDDRQWPYTTGSAGQLIVLESGDLSLVQ